MVLKKSTKVKKDLSVGAYSSSSDKKRALEAVLSSIEREYGKGAVTNLDGKAQDLEFIPTGSIGLDIALGIGGLPKGRIIEIYGPESSGKTTLALHVVAEAQKLGGNAAFIDAEHALDPQYAEKLGINIKELVLSQPSSGEEALDITDMLLRSGTVDVIVIDSVAALIPQSELNGEMGASQIGSQARLMSLALKKLAGSVSRSNAIVIFINQIRMKIGVMYGNPETTTGGNALKFYSSVRMEIRKITNIIENDSPIGTETRVKVVKNKVAPPFKTVEFDIMYGLGISKEAEIVNLGTKMSIIDKAGSWYSYNDERLGQGKEVVKKYLRDNPEVAEEIIQKIMRNVEDLKKAVQMDSDEIDASDDAIEGVKSSIKKGKSKK
ncbi:MAG: recombinase RecA [Alphaproteobacteria bacterium]|nr:recombinase RecA [Alphaproteobacteria bacterium]MBL0717740.1 recombinase RecA [Alphaproteobacteria bacterium]